MEETGNPYGQVQLREQSPVAPTPQKRLPPVKRGDGDPFTRQDVQYDLLHHIFADQTPAFTDQTRPEHHKATFAELYVNTLANSPKCTKVTKDKMVEHPGYAIEFAKLSLLVNIGRINTTVAFYIENRTVLRTYQSVPSLMKHPISERNMMDAPRLKAAIKAFTLPVERNNPPSAGEDLRKIMAEGRYPPTSVGNLLFILSATGSTFVRSVMDSSFDFTDLFTPIPVPSHIRAQVFLWLMFHFLEGGPERAANPFNDAYATANPGHAPLLTALTEQQMAQLPPENVDTEEERAFGKRMKAQRNHFLTTMVEEDQKRDAVEQGRLAEQQKEKRRIQHSMDKLLSAPHPEREYYTPSVSPPPSGPHGPMSAEHHRKTSTSHLEHQREIEAENAPPQSALSRQSVHQHQYEDSKKPSSDPQAAQTNSSPTLISKAGPSGHSSRSSQHDRSSRPTDATRHDTHYIVSKDQAPIPEESGESQHQSALQFAWSNTYNLNPLADSDDESSEVNLPMKSEFERRLWVLNRLRGRDLTPPEAMSRSQVQLVPGLSGMDTDLAM